MEGQGRLIVSRRERESVRIGTDITVTVTEVRGDKVKLAITAPRQVPLLRTELLANAGRHRRPAA